MRRRSFLRLGGVAGAQGAFGFGAGGQDPEIDYADVDVPFEPSYRLYGAAPTQGAEEDRARQILDAAPKAAPLLDIARYFEVLPDQNIEGQPYNAQWPRRWNPVLVGFYQPMSLAQPYAHKAGDTIDWGAAFINWCLARAGYQTSSTALSGSFRLGKGLGRATAEPRPGDIIVFKKADPAAAAAGHGHVGIFLGREPGGFRVLGAYRRAGKKYSSVNTSIIAEKNDRLVFDSVRSLATVGKVAVVPKPKI
jgi:hypothetical protein